MDKLFTPVFEKYYFETGLYPWSITYPETGSDFVPIRPNITEGDLGLFVATLLARITSYNVCYTKLLRYAMTRSDLLAGRITESPVQNQIRRSFHPTRSGNIHMVPEQYWFLHSTEEAEKMGIGSIAAIHGSPWAYDTYVPIFFAGSGVPAQINRNNFV